MKRLIISPHLDDAVLSAVNGMTPGSTTVLTVFAGIPNADTPVSDWDRASGNANAVESTLQRRREDTKALDYLGVESIHLDFLDAPYRLEPLTSLRLRDEIECHTDGFDEVWIPSGIGGHPDHRIVADLAPILRGEFDRVIYADLPYALDAWAGSKRGAAVWEPTDDEILDACPVGPFGRAVAVELTRDQVARKRIAIAHYTSQCEQLQKNFELWLPDEVAPVEWIWRAGRAQTREPHLAVLNQTSSSRAPENVRFTVAMRTMGNRYHEMSEALASLSTQTYRNFELVVVAHDLASPARDELKALVATLPDWLSDSTEIITAHGSGRGTPLNSALDRAAGDYLVFLDDDDFARADWLQEFHRMAQHHPGMCLHAGVVEVFMDGSTPPTPFPVDFDYVQHLIGNRSPINSLALPLVNIRAAGLRYREDLPVVEDWDFLLRAVEVCGVACSSAITAEYRRRPGRTNSQTDHSDAEWRLAVAQVHLAADQRPLILPAGSARELRNERLQRLGLEEDNRWLRNTLAVHESAQAELYAEIERLRQHNAAVTAEAARLSNESTKLYLANEQLVETNAKLVAENRHLATGIHELAVEAQRLRAANDALAKTGEYKDSDICRLTQLSEDQQRAIALLHETLHGIERSNSWRLTKPLRSGREAAARIRGHRGPQPPYSSGQT